ncbi:MAG: hypothetical protein ACOYNL_01455 [Rickettsiales bacterium]
MAEIRESVRAPADTKPTKGRLGYTPRDPKTLTPEEKREIREAVRAIEAERCRSVQNQNANQFSETSPHTPAPGNGKGCMPGR